MADPTSSSVSPQAQRVGSTIDEAIHLDLSAGFTSEHSTMNQVDGVYNYGATFYKYIDPKLKVYFYGGDQLENEKSVVNANIPRVPFGGFVYNTGLTYKFNPAFSLTGSYDQTFGHSYSATGPNVYHQINVETNIHVF